MSSKALSVTFLEASRTRLASLGDHVPLFMAAERCRATASANRPVALGRAGHSRADAREVIIDATHDDAHHAADRGDLGFADSAGSDDKRVTFKISIRHRTERRLDP